MSEEPVTDSAPVSAAGAGRSIGARLTAAREARRLEVGRVATELKLDVSTIRALEGDDHAALPAPIFVKGYLRSYARLVGLPEDELVREYADRVGELPPLVVIRIAKPAARVRLPSTRMLRNVVILLLLCIMAWLAWPVLEHLLQSRTAAPETHQQGQLELPPPAQ